jgi:hypothetical protein
MSDANYDATLGYRCTARAGDPVNPSPQPTPRAAPWERFSEPQGDDAVHRWQPEPPIESAEPIVEPQAGEAEKIGCHADGGVSVADVIAKVGAPTPTGPESIT